MEDETSDFKKVRNPDSPIAWKISTLSFLPRVAWELGFFSDQHTHKYLQNADTYGKQFPFGSWQEYAKSCLNGQNMEGPAHSSTQLKLQEYASILLSPGNLWSKELPEWKAGKGK